MEVVVRLHHDLPGAAPERNQGIDAICALRDALDKARTPREAYGRDMGFRGCGGSPRQPNDTTTLIPFQTALESRLIYLMRDPSKT